MNGDCWIPATWPAPANVHAGTSTRLGGCSTSPYQSLNLGLHVEDRPDDVVMNRQRLQDYLVLPTSPCWLEQVHGNDVIQASASNPPACADGSFTVQPNTVCAILTADCLPVLLCNQAGTAVSALHCGWRGLAAGIIAKAVEAFASEPDELMAWLGPAIGPTAYEIGQDVERAMAAVLSDPKAACHSHRPGHWYLDLYAAARQLLGQCGVHAVYGGDFCTHTEVARFYSYRRDGQTGRMATLIWIAD